MPAVYTEALRERNAHAANRLFVRRKRTPP
jgi:hypothetical protein